MSGGFSFGSGGGFGAGFGDRGGDGRSAKFRQCGCLHRQRIQLRHLSRSALLILVRLSTSRPGRLRCAFFFLLRRRFDGQRLLVRLGCCCAAGSLCCAGRRLLVWFECSSRCCCATCWRWILLWLRSSACRLHWSGFLIWSASCCHCARPLFCPRKLRCCAQLRPRSHSAVARLPVRLPLSVDNTTQHNTPSMHARPVISRCTVGRSPILLLSAGLWCGVGLFAVRLVVLSVLLCGIIVLRRTRFLLLKPRRSFFCFRARLLLWNTRLCSFHSRTSH